MSSVIVGSIVAYRVSRPKSPILIAVWVSTVTESVTSDTETVIMRRAGGGRAGAGGGESGGEHNQRGVPGRPAMTRLEGPRVERLLLRVAASVWDHRSLPRRVIGVAVVGAI